MNQQKPPADKCSMSNGARRTKPRLSLRRTGHKINLSQTGSPVENDEQFLEHHEQARRVDEMRLKPPGADRWSTIGFARNIWDEKLFEHVKCPPTPEALAELKKRFDGSDASELTEPRPDGLAAALARLPETERSAFERVWGNLKERDREIVKHWSDGWTETQIGTWFDVGRAAICKVLRRVRRKFSAAGLPIVVDR